MAIGTTAAILGSAALGAGGSLLASRNNSRAIDSATQGTLQSNADTLAFLRETRDQNNSLLAPFRQTELNRSNFWNEIMGYDPVSGNFGPGGNFGGGNNGGYAGPGGNSTGGPGTNFGTGPNGGGGRNVNPFFNTGGGGGLNFVTPFGTQGPMTGTPNTTNPDPVTTPVNTRGISNELTGGGEGMPGANGGSVLPSGVTLPNERSMQVQGRLAPDMPGGGGFVPGVNQPPQTGGGGEVSSSPGFQTGGGTPMQTGNAPQTGGGSMQQQMVPDGNGGFVPGGAASNGGGDLSGISPTIGGGVNGADRFNNSLFNALYTGNFNRERDRVDQNLAGSGLLFSGARLNAVENARANTFQNALAQYLNFGLGAPSSGPATNATVNNATQFGNQYAGINASSADARAQGAYANANNNNALLGNLFNLGGFALGGLG